MTVTLADTLIAAANKLDAGDAKRLWEFIGKLQANPAHPSLSLERVNAAGDRDFWSGRISQGLRAILHRDGDTITVLHADQHDPAYSWAERHSLQRHPRTGALQIVEAPEVVADRVERQADHQGEPGLFDHHDDDYLLSLGVPEDWLPTLRKVHSEWILLDVAERLPDEVADRLLRLAGGELVTPPKPVPANRPASESPDTQRRFYVLGNDAELARLLNAPMATWTAFLHPTQRKLAYNNVNGPLKVTGSAGTGKTVVALHRARHLASQGKRVLLTSYVTTLCDNLRFNLKVLCDSDELAHITVATVHAQALAVLKSAGEDVVPIDDSSLRETIEKCCEHLDCPLDPSGLVGEWSHVIADQGLTSWPEYRSASRAGRGRPLSVRDRKAVWQIFERVFQALDQTGKSDWPTLCRRATAALNQGKATSPFDAVVVDELQDLTVQDLRLLLALGGDGPDGLTLVGDSGQRIYSRPIVLSKLGIKVVGRSHTLRINYRTTEQIKRFADRVLAGTSDDMDGGTEDRRARSLLRGPEPKVAGFKTAAEQADFIAQNCRRLTEGGLAAEEIAVFARSKKLLEPVREQLVAAGLAALPLDRSGDDDRPGVRLGTMHRAKGLEFKAVFVADASKAHLPPPWLLNQASDPQDLRETRDRERHLFYVSMTRARDELVVTWVGEPSPFLEEILTAPPRKEAN